MAAGFALIVLAAVVLGGWWLLGTQQPPDPQAAAETVADDYVEAWQAWNLDRMADLVRDPPDGYVPMHTALRDALAPTATSVTRGALTLRDGQADADLTIALTPENDDAPMQWRSHLVLQRAGGEWQVVWTPQTIHPELRDGFGWRVDEVPAPRAPILGVDAEPLTAVAGQQGSGGVDPGGEGPPLRDRGFAQHVLGRVGPAPDTAAPDTAAPDSEAPEVGRYGLEAAFDEQLSGHPGRQVVITQPDGDVHAVVDTLQQDPPMALHTTLDATVQQAVENALVGATHPTAVVVIDPRTGAIRAVASRPLAGYNRAFEGRYAPGPGFRLVTAAALLGAGHAPDEPVDCPATAIVGGRRITNAADVPTGATTLRDAVLDGCDTAIARLAADLGDGVLTETARTFGFLDPIDLPLDTAPANFPPPADTGQRAVAAIGVGQVLASPLQMASVAAAVASGTWHAPTLLADDAGESGEDDNGGGSPLAERATAAFDDWFADGGGVGGRLQTPGQDLVNEWYVGVRDDLGVAVLVEGAEGGSPLAAPIATRIHTELDDLRS